MSNQYCKVKQVINLESAPINKGKIKRNVDWIPRATDTARKDIKDWRVARAMAESYDFPSNYQIQTLYERVMDDGTAGSQVANRQAKVFNVNFNLKVNGEINQEQTEIFKNNTPWRDIFKAILDTTYFEYSLGQLDWTRNVDGSMRLTWETLPRTNVIPQKGIFLPDYLQPDNTVKYRDLKEYGIWLLEFGNTKKRGLLNKLIKHVLMKDFSQSCWAELCEIYGIPPRYIKTNTHDKSMLNRADKMMRDMGSAAYFIIDETEEFGFANGVNTNGDVYNNLITLCNNEMSMSISGAIIGQDTKNGSRSKDEVAQEVLWELIMQDLVQVQENMNNIVIPALKKLGILNGELKLDFDLPEDLQELWKRVKDSMDNYEFDIEWLNDKFGLQITGTKKLTPPSNQISVSESFFV